MTVRMEKTSGVGALGTPGAGQAEQAWRAAFADDVAAGMAESPKRLSCKYLYDELGSALFDAITLLPEYGVTRAEEALLQRVSGEVAEALVPGVSVTELGSGSGKKTTSVLRAILEFQREVIYQPIDISRAALESCTMRIGETPGVHVRAVEGQYLEGLQHLAADREPWPPMLVLFLGSNIGNFDRREAVAFLSAVRGRLRPGDALLVGADLHKPVSQLLAAYDDPAGVTAAFNLNLLGRLNRELGADFDLRAFRHEARWCESESRVEMHLRSLADQEVTIRAAGCRVRLAAGETIWTESSYKYRTEELDRLATDAGFRLLRRWIADEDWAFAENLWLVEGGR